MYEGNANHFAGENNITRPLNKNSPSISVAKASPITREAIG